MPSLGLMEIMVIAIVAVVFIGPERLPHAARWAGRFYGQMRRAADELQRAFVMEADRMDEEERLRELRRRREESLDKLKAEEDAGDGTLAQPEQHPPAEPEPDASGDVVPPGYSEEEWAELPEHIRAIVRRRDEEAS